MYIAKRWGMGAVLWTAALFFVLHIRGMAITFTDFLVAAAILGALTTSTVALYRRFRPPFWMSDGELVSVAEGIFRKHRDVITANREHRYVAIDPHSRRFVTITDQLDAISAGTKAFGHRNFYVRPIRDDEIPAFGKEIFFLPG